MATITKGKTFTSNETVTPTKLNDLVDKATISNIVNADIAANAAIADTKLATISTAGKVSGAAITSGNISTTGSISTTGTLTVGGTAAVTGNLTVNGVISGKINVNWISKTNADNNYVSTAEDLISADTRSAAFTIKLPANPAKFDSVTFADHFKTWDTKNLTIDRNTKLIEGLAENLICNVSGKQITLRYEEATIGWRIYT